MDMSHHVYNTIGYHAYTIAHYEMRICNEG
jgi:hypothetical protein